jgi:hypothetical protein
MRLVFLPLLAPLALTACTEGTFFDTLFAPYDAPPVEEVVTDAPVAGTPAFVAPRVASPAVDPEIAEQRAAGVSAAAANKGPKLGNTIASLGDPTEGGLWIETSLVSAPTTGKIEYPITRKTVEVELRPAGSGGGRASLAAFRALDAPLTGLPEFVIYGQ